MYCSKNNTYHKSETEQPWLKTHLKNIFIIIFIILTIVFLIGLNTHGNKTVSYVKVKVETGQSLWNIASNHNNKNEDIRKLIYRIKEINKLDDVILQPGQIIKIPADSIAKN